jgi:hypothetical protein
MLGVESLEISRVESRWLPNGFQQKKEHSLAGCSLVVAALAPLWLLHWLPRLFITGGGELPSWRLEAWGSSD